MLARHVGSAALILLACAGATAAEPFDTLIVNGRVFDGSGNSWFKADLGIREGRLAAIGDLEGAEAGRVIDAAGLAVAPGFIDVHTHVDEDVFEHPLAENFLRDGVTTIVTGNCGGSVLDVGAYLDRLAQEPAAINVATLVGHNSVLREVKGNVAGELTPEQMDKARGIVRKAMEGGAVGFSTGLIYTPGTYSKTEEIIELNKVSAGFGGVYATHMRSEATEIMEAIAEAIRIGEESGSRVQISHLKMPADVEKRLGSPRVALQLIEDARARGLEVWGDQYPYTASSTSISVLFPDWVLEDGGDAAKELLKDPEQKARAKADMAEQQEKERLRTDMDFARIASSRAYPEYAGLSIKEVAQIRKAKGDADSPASKDDKALLATAPPVTMDDQYETVIDIYQKGGAGMVYHTLNESAVEAIMQSPLVAVCSDAGIREFGVGMPHPRGYGSNARVLGPYVRERGVISLEEAIRKMTSLPATSFRFKDRGMLREGNWADVVVFDPATVTDKSTFEDPHHYSECFAWVLVNGVVVVEKDQVTGARPGMPIRR